MHDTVCIHLPMLVCIECPSSDLSCFFLQAVSISELPRSEHAEADHHPFKGWEETKEEKERKS